MAGSAVVVLATGIRRDPGRRVTGAMAGETGRSLLDLERVLCQYPALRRRGLVIAQTAHAAPLGFREAGDFDRRCNGGTANRGGAGGRVVLRGSRRPRKMGAAQRAATVFSEALR